MSTFMFTLLYRLWMNFRMKCLSLFFGGFLHMWILKILN